MQAEAGFTLPEDEIWIFNLSTEFPDNDLKDIISDLKGLGIKIVKGKTKQGIEHELKISSLCG